MKTLYAVTFVCLSLPALADVLAPIRADEGDNAAVTAPASQPNENPSALEFHIDEYNVGPVADVLDITPSGHLLDITSVGAGENTTASDQPVEDHSVNIVDFDADDYKLGGDTVSVVKPIEGAEFDGTSRDDGDAMWTIVRTLDFSVETTTEDDGTAGMTSPAMPKIDETPVNPDFDSFADGQSGDLKLAERIGETSIESGVWP